MARSSSSMTRMRHLRRENRWLDIELKSIQTATNVWTDAIWKSQKFRKGEHIMKKEHSKYQWIIGICCSENDGVKLYKYTGTVKKMKKRLLRLIKEDKKNDKENWESGSETVAELSDESNGEETCFCGYGSYSYYHIDYMAERVSNIEELSNCE